jgi:raffinose/stachyose/melibiose transport system permease protein
MKANAGGMSYKQVESIQRWILLMPGVILYTIFNFLPIIGLLILSLFEYYGFGAAPKFIGLQNFSDILFNDYIRENFLKALGNNFIFFGVIISILLSVGTMFALLLSFKTAGSKYYKTLFFLPYPLAGAAVAFMMQQIFSAQGPVESVLAEYFSVEEKVGFLNTAGPTGLFTLSFFYIWHRMGFAIILILSAILAVRTDLLEAAFLDGASRWQAIKNVVFPVLAPAFIIVTVIIMVDTFNNADYQILLFGNFTGDTDVMGSYLYRMSFGPDARGFGFGSAVGLVTAIIIFPAAMYSALKNIKG